MRFFLFIISLVFYVSASGEISSQTCKGCHPVIYKEYYGSIHQNASLEDDKIHAAMWGKHPNYAQDDYTCASCHSPEEQNKDERGISCIYCHSIESIQNKDPHNKNILTQKSKKFFSADKEKRGEKVKYKDKSGLFGLLHTKSGSPYHEIDYSNDNFYDANICMGCHSHLKSKKGFDICNGIDPKIGSQSEDQNCITCHMPKVSGSISTIKKTQKHSFHGFSGVHNASDMLSKYVKLSLEKTDGGFIVNITNEAPHKLLLQPLRVAALRVDILREKKKISLEQKSFVRVLGNNGKPSMPWDADEVFKDTMIGAKETKNVRYDTLLQKGDQVEVNFGFYIVNPKIAKKLNMDIDKKATEFTLLSHESFDIK